MASGEFSPQIKDLIFHGEAQSGYVPQMGEIPEMPVGERQFHRWLANGLLSGWATKISSEWHFVSGIVEHAWEVHRQLGARHPPPSPEGLSGYISVEQFRKQLRVTSGQVYPMLRKYGEELGTAKHKGRLQIPMGITSHDIIIAQFRLT